jgi:hypothetical protein
VLSVYLFVATSRPTVLAIGGEGVEVVAPQSIATQSRRTLQAKEEGEFYLPLSYHRRRGKRRVTGLVTCRSAPRDLAARLYPLDGSLSFAPVGVVSVAIVSAVIVSE